MAEKSERDNSASREATRMLAEKITGGKHNSLARLLDVRRSTVTRWLSGDAPISSIAVLLLSLYDVLAERMGGEEAAREAVVEAARRLGRERPDRRFAHNKRIDIDADDSG